MNRRELLIASGFVLALPSAALAGVPARPSIRRRLTLKNANTGETFDGTYRDEKGPIVNAMADLARLLRDHHSNTVAPIDVNMLDFLADVMLAVNQPKATVLSGYRTEATNAKLIAAKFDAAENSQHLLGRAVDVTFDRRLAEAEQVARQMQQGGVGWYPGSHFIHLDSGPLRSWRKLGRGFDRLLASRPKGRPPTLQERQALHRAIARRDFLARKGT